MFLLFTVGGFTGKFISPSGECGLEVEICEWLLSVKTPEREDSEDSAGVEE